MVFYTLLLYPIFHSILQIIHLLQDHMHSSPQSLGDATREGKDEMIDRHERTLGATCKALIDLIEIDDIWFFEAVLSVIQDASFPKNMIQSKYAVVRMEAYRVVQSLKGPIPESLMQHVSPAILGSLAEHFLPNQEDMLLAVIQFSKRFPSCWEHINIRKAFLPKLWALIQRARYTSPDLLRYVLPLIDLLPDDILAQPAQVYSSLMMSVWEGLRNTKEETTLLALSECASECTVYFIKRGTEQYWKENLESTWLATVTASIFHGGVSFCIEPFFSSLFNGLKGTWKQDLILHVVAINFLGVVDELDPAAKILLEHLSKLDVVKEKVRNVILGPLITKYEAAASQGSTGAVQMIPLIFQWHGSDMAASQLTSISSDQVEAILARLSNASTSAEEFPSECALLALRLKTCPDREALYAKALSRAFCTNMEVGVHLLKSAMETRLNISSTIVDELIIEKANNVEIVRTLFLTGHKPILTNDGQQSVLNKISGYLREPAWQQIAEDILLTSPEEDSAVIVAKLGLLIDLLFQAMDSSIKMLHLTPPENATDAANGWIRFLQSEFLVLILREPEVFLRQLWEVVDKLGVLTLPKFISYNWLNTIASTLPLNLRHIFLAKVSQGVDLEKDGALIILDLAANYGLQELSIDPKSAVIVLEHLKNVRDIRALSCMALATYPDTFLEEVLSTTSHDALLAVANEALILFPDVLAQKIHTYAHSENDQHNLLTILRATSDPLRSSLALIQLSGIDEILIRNAGDASKHQIVAACCPMSRFSGIVLLQNHTFNVNSNIWYLHMDGHWEEAIITSIDRSVDPLSYGIQLGDNNRETVRERIALRKEGELPPRNMIVDIQRQKVPLYTNDEKFALIEMLPAVLDDKSVAGAIIASVIVAQCAEQLEVQHWHSLFNFTRSLMCESRGQTDIATRKAASILSRLAQLLSSSEINSPSVALQVVRQLAQKGLLERSDKARAAVGVMNCELSQLLADLTSFELCCHSFALLGQLLNNRSLINPYTDDGNIQTTQSACCSDLLDIFLATGSLYGVFNSAGGTTREMMVSYISTYKECFEFIECMVEDVIDTADDQFLHAAIDRAAALSMSHGSDALGSLVNLAVYLSSRPAWKALRSHEQLLMALVTGNMIEEDNEQWVAVDAFSVFLDHGVYPELALPLCSNDYLILSRAWSLLAGYLLALPKESKERAASWLQHALPLFFKALNAVVAHLPLKEKKPVSQLKAGLMFSSQTICRALFQSIIERKEEIASQYLYASLLYAMPAYSRLWFLELKDRGFTAALEKYTSTFVSPHFIATELAAVAAMAKQNTGLENFTVRGVPASREVVAILSIEEGHQLELVIKMPMSIPLRSPVAECRKSVGVSEARMRRWLLSICVFLRAQNCTLADAVLLWKRNIDKEFEGHEECLICFSIIQPSNAQLPRLSCRTCRKKFHGQCLYKWFKSSGKSTCPHCQGPW